MSPPDIDMHEVAFGGIYREVPIYRLLPDIVVGRQAKARR